jgi:hypothetical protein
MTPLQWELNWIDQNAHRYDSIDHTTLVKFNITKRYQRNALLKQLQSLRPRILK